MRKPPQSSPGLGRLPACFLTLFAVLAVPSVAQNRLKAVTAASLVKEPNGLKIASLAAGVSYATGKAVGTHVEVSIEGWLPASAVVAANRDGFDLSVSAGGGARLRATPNGAVIGRMQEGTLMSKAGSEGKWVKVKRTGFALRTTFAAPEPPKATALAMKPAPAPASVPDTTRPRHDAPAADSVSGMALIKGGAVLSAAPDGKPVFTAESATAAEVVGRKRDWIKVRIEGWVRSTDVTAEAVSGPGSRVRWCGRSRKNSSASR